MEILKNKTKEDILSNIFMKRSIDDLTIIDTLCKKLKDKERDIKSLSNGTRSEFKIPIYQPTTKYHNYYNVINFGFNEVDIILDKIKEMVFELTGETKFYIKMWYNIYRNGGYIPLHSHFPTERITHNLNEKNMISGHCFLYSSKPTKTSYYFISKNKTLLGNSIPDETKLDNIPGEITLFSSFTPHEFKKWDGDIRIGLAFDIITNTDKISTHEIPSAQLILIE